MTQDIYVNGGRLAITHSLAVALFHLRPKAKPLKIWIDQICINQKDTDEKTEQVGFMGHIYRNTEGHWFGWDQRRMGLMPSLMFLVNSVFSRSSLTY